MSVQLITAPPAGGKTTYCIDKIVAIRQKDPFTPVKVITADKLQMSYWKKKLAARGKSSNRLQGFVGTEIISFPKFAVDILDKLPDSPKLIPAHLDMMCMRQAIMITSEKDSFRYFTSIRKKPGLLRVFSETIKELQRNCIFPEDLLSSFEDDEKLYDTGLVYREYLKLLDEKNWISSGGLLQRTTQVLNQKMIQLSVHPLLVIDGFDRFSKDQILFIQALLPEIENILITLPLLKDRRRAMDKQQKEMADEITAQLSAERVDLHTTESFSLFRQIADRILSYDARLNFSYREKEELILAEEPFQASETKIVLKQIKAQIIRKNISPGECALFVPDLQTYAPIIRQAAREMGIPMYFADHQRLSSEPAASVLKRLLHLYPDNFNSNDLLSVLRSPFLSGCPDSMDVDSDSYQRDLYFLDKACRSMNIIEGIEEWLSGFAVLMSDAEKARNQEDDEKTYELPAPEKIKRIADSFAAFINFLTPLEGFCSRRKWVEWLENLLKSLRFYQQIDSTRGNIFINALRTVLKRMIFTEEKLSLPAITYEEFLNELNEELETSVISIQGNPGERVFVGDITQVTGCRWKTVALMGFAEGLFPRVPKPLLILPDDVIARLNLKTSFVQSLSIFHALTRADETLIISRPQKTDKGEVWPASIYWQSIVSLLSSIEKVPDEERPYSIRTLTQSGILSPVVRSAASIEEAVFDFAKANLLLSDSGSELIRQQMSEQLSRAGDALTLMYSQNEGNFTSVPDLELKKALGDELFIEELFSCSAVEMFLECPFHYFLSKKLKLEQPSLPGVGMDAAQLGTINHLVMEQTFPAGTIYSSVHEALERAKEVIPRVLENAPENIGFRVSELWKFEKKRLSEKLLDSIEAMYKDKKLEMNNQWKSIGSEVRFGYSSDGIRHAEPLVIETEFGQLKLRGSIDRLDVRDDGLLRVVDYKTSGKNFKQEFLDAGSHIQAGVYAAAAVRALKYGKDCIGTYWEINGKKAHLTAEYHTDDEQVPYSELLESFVRGISDASYPAYQAFENCPSYCPAAGWCRRFTGGN